MCYDKDARPPIPVIGGGAIATEDLTLTASDGTTFAAYAAVGPGVGGPAVVILPDVRGLHKFYEELADRFAERGIAAVAIDYFGRTAGVAKRADDFVFADHVAKTKTSQIALDVAAAAAWLRQGKGNANRAMFTLGFCFGGSNSWYQAMAGHRLSGAIGFYGHPTRAARDGGPSVTERVTEIRCPILGLMGGADQGIPAEEVEKFRSALKTAGKHADIHIYPGTPHSFFDRRFVEHASASDDAWKRALAFIEANSKTPLGAAA